MSGQRLGSRAIIGNFYARLEQATAMGWGPRVAMHIDSDQASEDYAWLGMAPKMREWIGGRHAKGLRDNGFSIRNKTFEATLGIPVDWIRRDKTGQIAVRINELADRVAAHPASLLSTLIIDGESTVCYDGSYFFHTAHTEGDSGAQDNDLSIDISALPCTNHGIATAPSVGEMSLSIQAAVQQIIGFKDDVGEPMNELAREFMVMVPTTQYAAASAAVTLPFVDRGDSNVIPGQRDFVINVVPNARLNASWSAKFAVFRTDGSVKPFIHQVEEDVSMNVLGEGSEHEFKENEHQFGVKKIENVGYGFWQNACLVTMI